MTIKGIVYIFCSFFILPHYSFAQGFIISEVMFNPNGNENAREFVEILNISDNELSLEGFLIGDGTGFDAVIPAEGFSWYIPSGSYALILDPDYYTADEPYNIPDSTPLFTVDDKAIGNRGLSNSTAETVYLISAEGDTLSMVSYSLDCPPGHSWERIIPHGGDGMENFNYSKEEDGTPGQKNSVTPESQNPALDESYIRFNPTQPQMGDDIEIILSYRNAGLDSVSDVEVTVWMFPNIQAGIAAFSDEVEPGEISAEVSLYMNNLPGGRLAFTAAIVSEHNTYSAEDDTVMVILDVSVPSGTILLNEVMAAPENGYPEWIEIYNKGNTPVDIYNWSITDSKRESFGLVAEHILIATNGYAVISDGALGFTVPDNSPVIIVEKFPPLNNDGDSVNLLDFTGAPVDSMSYEDTQSGYSFELISPDMHGKTTGWDVSVDPSGATPGKVNSINYSSVPGEGDKKIEQPKLSVNPNPFSDIITISYQLPFPLARVRLNVYDRRGRLVAKLRDAEESGSEWTGTWDGGENGTKLPAGPYILNFEVFDKRSGKVYTERKIIVIAKKL